MVSSEAPFLSCFKVVEMCVVLTRITVAVTSMLEVESIVDYTAAVDWELSTLIGDEVDGCRVNAC